LRPQHDEDLHDLFGERYERGATIVTSNLDFSEWGEALPNRLLGATNLDRAPLCLSRCPRRRQLSRAPTHAQEREIAGCENPEIRQSLTSFETPHVIFEPLDFIEQALLEIGLELGLSRAGHG